MSNQVIEDSDLPIIKELLEELHPKEVAKKYEVAESTIRHHAKKHGFKMINVYDVKRRSCKTIKNKHAVLESTKEDINKGYTTTEACERHNISTLQYQELNKIGLKELKRKGI